jgi:hypothetical protein
VGKRAFGGWDSRSLESISQRQGRVARQRYAQILPAMRRAVQADLAALGTWYESLCRAIAGESGAAFVVDASKDMRQALVLAGAGIDVRVIHLIRDVRGVAFSMSKRHAARTLPTGSRCNGKPGPPSRRPCGWAS